MGFYTLSGFHDLSFNSRMKDLNGNSEEHRPKLQQLEPFALNMLYELISLVHDAVKVGGQHEVTKSTSIKDSFVDPNSNLRQTAGDSPSDLVIDPFANIFRAVEPLVLKEMLQAMVVSVIFLFYPISFYIGEVN